MFDAQYAGDLPSSATDPGIPRWLQASFPNHATVATERIGIQIRFAESRINLGNIATGATKSTIDCLYPLIGGNAGAPENWKIDALRVSKGHPKLDGTLGVRVWRF